MRLSNKQGEQRCNLIKDIAETKIDAREDKASKKEIILFQFK